MVMRSTFMGGSLANGAWPCASSRMVIPKDQMSARLLYLINTQQARTVTQQCDTSIAGVSQAVVSDQHTGEEGQTAV